MSFKQKRVILLALLPVGVMAFVMIINMNPPFSWVFDLLRENSAIFKESLRFPFTKFSLLLMFVFSVYFAAFFDWFFAKIKFSRPVLLLVSTALILYCWPMFQGYLIDPRLRINIPQEYFEAFKWFQHQPADTRVAPFPIDTLYGWQYENWGYQGSGFFWFGIPQAFLARDFDRWMPQNENYYWEISQAVYSKNLPLLESVLNKYRVNWLLLDKNIINPSSPKAVYTDELERLVGQSASIKLAKEFGNIKVYSYQLRAPTKSFISLAQNLPNVGPMYKWGNLDQAYFDVGDYISIGTNDGTKKSPYGDLSDPTRVGQNLDSHLTVILDQVTNFVKGCGGSGICTRGIVGENPDSLLEYPHTNNSIANYIYEYRTLFTGRSQADLEFDPTKIPFIRASLASQEELFYPTLSHRDGYLITVKAKNISGKPFLFWIEDLNSRRAVLETYLPSKLQTPNSKLQTNSNSSNSNTQTSFFVLPPMEPDGLGYSFHFENQTIGKQAGQNELESFEVWKIDYWDLVKQKNVQVVQGAPEGRLHMASGQARYTTDFSVEHPNPAWYRIDLPNPVFPNGKTRFTLVLAQSYEPGWAAVSVNSNQQVSRSGEHILINNWANGWELNGNERIVYLIFWPQILEFAGFGLLTIFITGSIIKMVSSRINSHASAK